MIEFIYNYYLYNLIRKYNLFILIINFLILPYYIIILIMLQFKLFLSFLTIFVIIIFKLFLIKEKIEIIY